ncbi:p21-activated protein kinase-interacting protein 1-like [Cylas formicarius]|uniref:p21-activated protein kinase-interacting protein 1-like n=1 Tax=Cylas formicarius TaxID=197179 RepID=UPI0029587E6D|nr:p21-activated protein kinase-interacting protein 1-like [Cylas formicarius]
MPKSASFEIIVGTYEEYLLGYVFSGEAKTLTNSFASHDHSGSVRCVSTYDHYLASGASDDRIIIYDMKTRKEHCMLTHHDASISCVCFSKDHSHVISASQDGVLTIVRVGNWQVEKIWDKPHKGCEILDIAVHSSGKLAFTLGADHTLHTWNLVKGRSAYIINLNTKCKDPKSIEKIVFAPDDNRFLLYGGRYTEIWCISLGGVLKVIEHEQKVTCSTWVDNDTLFVGYEDGNIARIDINSESKKIKKGHESRVKAAKYFEGFVVSACSDGEIKVWTRKLKEVSSVKTGCRITCLCVAGLMCEIKKEEEELVLAEKEELLFNKKSKVVIEVDVSDDEKAHEEIVKKSKRKKRKLDVISQTEETSRKSKRKGKKNKKNVNLNKEA